MSANKEFNHGIDFKNLSKVVNLADGTANKDAVNKSQLDAVAVVKQDISQGGAGIKKESDGITFSVDLAVAGNSYDEMTISNTNHSSLNGVYSRLPFQAKLEYAGTTLDLTIGDVDVDWNAYYKDNGSGVWAVVMKRDIDTNESTNPESGSWLAVLVTTNPASFSYSGSGVMTVNNFIPNYQAVDYDMLTFSNESSGDGKFSPDSGDNNVSFGAGSTPAGLKFENDKLGVDFANTIGENASTKIFPSSVVKTFIDEEINESKQASNNVFSNSVAQYSGNPLNVQSALERASVEIKANDTDISNLQTKDTEHDERLLQNRTVLGVGIGDSNLGAYGSAKAGHYLTDNTNVKLNIKEVAEGSS